VRSNSILFYSLRFDMEIEHALVATVGAQRLTLRSMKRQRFMDWF
jgi:hypothetical protein